MKTLYSIGVGACAYQCYLGNGYICAELPVFAEGSGHCWLSWLAHLFGVAWSSGTELVEWQTRVMVQ